MEKYMTKKIRIITLGILALIIILGVFYFGYGETHTFSLTDESATDSYLKSEQIQPVFGTVKVWGIQDTDVCFTDVENPEVQYKIGYITPGMTETIKLEKGRWYSVRGAGEITVRMVNARVH
ncbi:MAG: hypothetical protein II842_11225 [Butyrivibrio sp.]|nr:hypothetical protein [Butyrivibrio sp.]